MSFKLIGLAAALMTGPATAATLDCPALDGVEAIRAKAPDYLIFGEAHGTRELPALFGDLVCAYAASGPVTVGLEFLPAEKAALDAYLVSDGGPQSRSTLLASEGWGDPHGRASQAILDLVDSLRRFKTAGADIAVTAFDHPTEQPGTSDARETGMARLLMAAKAARPAAPVLALTGAGHAGKSAWSSFDPPFLAMSQHLPADRTLAVAVVRGGGEVWACRALSEGAAQECRPWPSTARDAIPTRGVRLGTSREGYDAIASTGAPYSASPPARGVN